MSALYGAELLATALERAGVTHVFGLPGTQNAALFPALARTSIRVVMTGSELMAAFMANGFFRAGGGVPVVAAIPGPGFTYALTGFAEAAHDSAALVLLTGVPGHREGKRFDLQALDQVGMVRGLAKRTLRLDQVEDTMPVVADALSAATSRGPGPVLLEVDHGLLVAPAPADAQSGFMVEPLARADDAELGKIVVALRAARRVVVIAGQGTADCADDLAAFVARRPSMVMTTVSARGVLPESHPWSLAHDFLACSVAETNRLLAEADLVLVLGCRTSHNGTGGYGLQLPEACTVHVDLDPDVLGANYTPRWAVRAPVADVLTRLLAALAKGEPCGSDWSPDDVARWCRSLRENCVDHPPEPAFPGVPEGTAAAFFAALQSVLPDNAILVTDTGLHQIMARTHLRVEHPRGLLVPADFQSMGFGLPAAIGAALAAPRRRVVAILGDGGLMMAGLELATAVRERVDLTAIVLCDGHLGQIRAQQIGAGAGEAAVALAGLDLAALAATTGARYESVAGDAAADLSRALATKGVVLVAVPLGDSQAMRRAQWRGKARGKARRFLGRRGIDIVRKLLRRP